VKHGHIVKEASRLSRERGFEKTEGDFGAITKRNNAAYCFQPPPRAL
jgi:hypothetical protein